MKSHEQLNEPWLVAVWPGIGNVAINAGYYLMAKLGVYLLREFPAHELFDIEYVDVENGLIRTARLPLSRFFVWEDPKKEHDIVLFIGEAQPPLGKYAFCCRIIKYAKQLGVERVFTFAAMATDMTLDNPSRIFGAATDPSDLTELKQRELQTIEKGQIGGLNGVLLGAAVNNDVRGVCLLGETPQLFAQFPFPKASLGVLRVFSSMANIKLDLGELVDQTQAVEHKLAEILESLKRTAGQQFPTEEETFKAHSEQEQGLSAETRLHIEQLFEESRRDHARAYELKRELDRHNVFKEYEDRFLDLFTKDKGEDQP